MDKSKYCQECGKIINVKAVICPHCGVRVLGNNSKIVAALLAFFLGGFGIHKFYLGQTGMGIVYLLFCWTLIPGFIAFIEGIIFLIMSDEVFNQKYIITSNINGQNIISVIAIILIGIFILICTGNVTKEQGLYNINNSNISCEEKYYKN